MLAEYTRINDDDVDLAQTKVADFMMTIVMMTIVMIAMIIIGHHDDRMMMMMEERRVAGGDYNYDQHRDDIIMMRMDGCIPIPVTSEYRQC